MSLRDPEEKKHYWQRHAVWAEERARAKHKKQVTSDTLQADTEAWVQQGHEIEQLDCYGQVPYRKPPVMWTR